jgi:hypothetical protein
MVCASELKTPAQAIARALRSYGREKYLTSMLGGIPYGRAALLGGATP